MGGKGTVKPLLFLHPPAGQCPEFDSDRLFVTDPGCGNFQVTL